MPVVYQPQCVDSHPEELKKDNVSSIYNERKILDAAKEFSQLKVRNQLFFLICISIILSTAWNYRPGALVQYFALKSGCTAS